MSFEGKRVLVTGGSRGIGRATAKAFREAGARVAVNGRTMESLGGDGLIAAPGDIGTVASCQAVVGATLDAFGGLDVLVNSAGVAKARTIETCDEALKPGHRHQPQGHLLLHSRGRHGLAREPR